MGLGAAWLGRQTREREKADRHMASERRAQVVRLAEILGVDFEPSIGTAELMEMCVTEADCRMGSGASEGRGSEDESDEQSDDEQPPAGMRPALRSVPTPALTSSRAEHRAGGNGARKLRKAAERFESERSQRPAEAPAEGSIRASNGAILHAAGVVPPVRHGFSYGTQEGGRVLQVPDGLSLAEAHAGVGLPLPRGASASDVAQEDAQEVAPVLTQSRRGQRRGGARKAS